jgi:homocitrate synthase
MIVGNHEYVTTKYKLHKLKEIEDMVAEAVEINVPFVRDALELVNVDC